VVDVIRPTLTAPPANSSDPLPATTDGGPTIDASSVAAYTVPTDGPETDGTLRWTSTTMVIVRLRSGGTWGLGYSYAHAAAAQVAADLLLPALAGLSALSTTEAFGRMVAAVRNIGRPGLVATAISAVDNAMWDLKARLLGLSLVDLLGSAHDAIPPYGSGGFTNYSDAQLRTQLGDWATAGFRRVKMKVGREPDADPHRTEVARAAIGPAVELFVDGNGAYDRKAALDAASRFADRDVRWFEEPVTSDDLEGLRLLRDRGPAGMAIAAGEYNCGPLDARRLLEAGAVDVLQADATRCLGVTGFLAIAALCEAQQVPLSAHCAPSLHVPLTCATRPAVHLEWFHDHVRIEQRLFDGAPVPHAGLLRPDRSRPGFGLALRERDAEPYLVWRSR
jgi:L-alanine-DL-glutamate epimerase-like enolase superfamily enzyme